MCATACRVDQSICVRCFLFRFSLSTLPLLPIYTSVLFPTNSHTIYSQCFLPLRSSLNDKNNNKKMLHYFCFLSGFSRISTGEEKRQKTDDFLSLKKKKTKQIRFPPAFPACVLSTFSNASVTYTNRNNGVKCRIDWWPCVVRLLFFWQ